MQLPSGTFLQFEQLCRNHFFESIESRLSKVMVTSKREPQDAQDLSKRDLGAIVTHDLFVLPSRPACPEASKSQVITSLSPSVDSEKMP